MPSDPVELLTAAAKVNGLNGAEMKPWHLKATFESLDEAGKVKDAGTFEEWWVSDLEWRSSYTSAGFAQATYHTEKGTFRTGEPGPLPGFATEMEVELTAPMGKAENIATEKWESKLRDSQVGKLLCVSTKVSKGHYTAMDQGERGYCFEASRPILRTSSRGAEFGEILHSSLGMFRGRYVSRELQLVSDGKALMLAHVNVLEGLQPDEVAIVPPAEAKVAPRTLWGTGDSLKGLLKKAKQTGTTLPASALANKQGGIVAVRAVIGTDGHVQWPVAMDGPEQLHNDAKAQTQAVEFQPIVVDGNPVEVQFVMHIAFAHGQ